MNGWMDRWMDGQSETGRQTETDRQTDGHWIDRWMDG